MKQKWWPYLLVCPILMVGLTAHTADIDQTYPASGLKSVRLEHTEGSVKIVGADSDLITLRSKKVAGDLSCATKVVSKDEGLDIKTSKSIFGSITCRVDIVLSIPQGIKLDVMMGAGGVNIDGIKGDLNIELGTGSIAASIRSKVTRLKMGSGKIDISWLDLLNEGSVDIQTGMGESVLEFPNGMPINASSLQGGFARINNEIGNNEKASFKVGGKIGFGSITLKYRS